MGCAGPYSDDRPLKPPPTSIRDTTMRKRPWTAEDWVVGQEESMDDAKDDANGMDGPCDDVLGFMRTLGFVLTATAMVVTMANICDTEEYEAFCVGGVLAVFVG